MNESNKVLEEIKERWKPDIYFLNEHEKHERILKIKATHPACDIRYLLNRLEAAERAAQGTATVNQWLVQHCPLLKGKFNRATK